jgi:hypothetical protein
MNPVLTEDSPGLAPNANEGCATAAVVLGAEDAAVCAPNAKDGLTETSPGLAPNAKAGLACVSVVAAIGTAVGAAKLKAGFAVVPVLVASGTAAGLAPNANVG